MRAITEEKPKIFFDFDNTITTFDVLDSIISRFSVGDGWKKLEDKWEKGKIGSRECLKGQIDGVRVSKDRLDRHLASVKIDPYFKKIVSLLRSNKIDVFILSDNFDYVLRSVLRRYGINGLDVYSNRLKLSGGRLVPEFPISNSECHGCGHCKKTTMRRLAGKGTLTVYIGDGLSDRCASEEADVVFAKGALSSYLQGKGIGHIRFNELKDVYNYLKESI
jgi:2,3-diketo-5-methylthio-1-phosphopentane phosphatase